MPILGGSVTFSRFRVEGAPADTARWLTKGLRTGAFEPIDLAGSDEARAAGFVELEDADATGFARSAIELGEHVLFAYRIDSIPIRASTVKAELGRWEAQFSDENGRPPGKRERAEQRDAIRRELRGRTPPLTKVLDVSWSLSAKELRIWAASRKVVEEIAGAIEAGFQVKLQPVVPAALAAWAGVDVEALAPTPGLVGGAPGAEVRP